MKQSRPDEKAGATINPADYGAVFIPQGGEHGESGWLMPPEARDAMLRDAKRLQAMVGERLAKEG